MGLNRPSYYISVGAVAPSAFHESVTPDDFEMEGLEMPIKG